MNARRLLVAAAFSAAAVLAPTPAAWASGDATISYVEAEDGTLQLLVTVPRGAEIDLDGVGVTVAGEVASATAEPAGDAEVSRTTVLAIDTSDSMEGERFSAAKAAALTFLDTVPDDVEVGIVTFDQDVSQALEPTTDRAAATAVIEGLELARETRLYDGVLAGVSMTGTEGQRTMLLLSDGADTSDTDLETAVAALEDSGVLLDVVALEHTGQAREALAELSTAGQGQVIDADPDALAAAFDRAAGDLAGQVLVSAEIPDSVTASEATVVVTLPDGDTTLTAEAFAEVGGATAGDDGFDTGSAGPLSGLVMTEAWFYAGLGALGLGLLVLMLTLVPRPKRDLTPEERASAYTDRVAGRATTGARTGEPDPALTQAKEAAAKVLEHNKTLEERIMNRLEGAGNPLKPSEWLLLHVGIFLASGVVGMLLGGGSLVLGLVFLGLGAVGPWFYLGFKRGRRRKAFERSLPDTLQLMSGSLAAGLSLAQSVDTIVREGGEPVSSEFRRVLVETRLGVSLEDALGGVAERFESKDFEWVVMAINIQRQVGGNLAELLDTVAATMREREYMRRQVAALAAEGKLSAYVLAGLPPLFMLYLLMTKRDYVWVMFTEPLGWVMLGGAGLLLSVGGFWMSKLVKVEV
jgi:tight adherence protein B